MAQAQPVQSRLDKQLPLAKAVRRRLRKRLKRILQLSKRAREESCRQSETVHQLRVATRRCQVILDMFPDCLPRKNRLRVRKWIKNIRQAAGHLRDLDVLLENWNRVADEDRPSPGAISLAENRRNEAAKILKAALRQADQAGLKKRARRLARRTKWRGPDSEPDFSTAALQKLAPAADRFFDRAHGPFEDYNDLHRLRIAAKHLRYGLEVMSGGLNRAFRTWHLKRLAKIQEHLGQLNDQHTAQLGLRRWADEAEERSIRCELEHLAERAKRRRDELQQDFLADWDAQRIDEWERDFWLAPGHPTGTTEEEVPPTETC